ncbi:MAG: hypothetical protein GYA51_05020 [Candidatus Methanofastidiosa archaeon]|nr:hypothetical protein [Candidatus Methanofastidiosa archaeon]
MHYQNYEVYIDGCKEDLAGKFNISYSSKSFVGHGKVHFPYKNYLWNLLNTEGLDFLIRGGIDAETNLFRGMIKNAIIDQQKYIIVEVDDYGQNFRRNYDGRYRNETLEKVLTSLGSECDYTTILDDVSPVILDTQVSRANTIEYGELNIPSDIPLTGDIQGTISGNFKSSCPNCHGTYNRTYYITTVLNYCPNCGKYDSLIVNESTEENKYQCTNCKAQYCGIDGYQTNLEKKARLKILYGPVEGILGEPLNYTSTPSTYEDEIKALCQIYNLYPYLTQYKELIIKQYRGTPAPDFEIDLDDVMYKSYKFINSSQKEIKKVIVNYNGGSTMVSEEGYESVDKIVLDHPELDRSQAEILASQTLAEQLQSLTSEMYVDVALRTNYSVGSWARLPNFHQPWLKNGQIMYIDSINMNMNTIDNDRIQKATLTLKYTPTIMQRRRDIPPMPKPTFDQIIREALTLRYSTMCQDYQCVDDKRTGDSHGISDWLYINFNNIGVRSRIISYDSPYLPTSNHYIVQLYRSGKWYDLDYKGYGFDIRLQPSKIKSNVQIITGNN